MKHWLLAYICLTIIKFSQHVKNDEYFRLPKNVVPEYYKLQIQTVLETNNFFHKSSVEIDILCVKPTNRITLHSRNLTIINIEVYNNKNFRKVKTTSYTLGEYDFLHINLHDKLKDGNRYKLMINFTGEIGTGMSGYYRSKYTNEKGEEKWITTTSFEPTNARAAFPCFDEPALTAVFSIELTYDQNLVAISNTPRKHRYFKDENNWQTRTTKKWSVDTFFDTQKIPTYSVAYMVLDFKKSTISKSNTYGDTTINVWARKQSLAQVEYAKGISPMILSFFEKYFDIAYPLNKSDLVAVPDCPMGAIQNWGLIIFRESNLLYIPSKSTENEKYLITKKVAQEMAHDWFGNLVNIKWWKYLWIKEGFVTYLAQVAMEYLVPKWKSFNLETFLENLDAVYDTDGLRYSKPISIPINDPDKVFEIYNTIIYSKGACIIRMMEHFLGAQVLKKGIELYLKNNKYKSTDENNLWSALSTVALEAKVLPEHVTFNTIMNSWTRQAGYPVVSVDRDYTEGTINVTQFRFLEVMKRNYDTCYWIPLTFTTEMENNFNKTKQKIWLECPFKRKNIAFKNAAAWVLFNVQISGLYRVNYDVDNWNLLIKQLHTDHKKIKLLNRILLIEDVVELAMTDNVDFQIVFDLLHYLQNENSYLVWRQALKKLFKIRDFLFSLPEQTFVENYIWKQIIHKYNSLGGINSDKQFTKLDQLIVKTACSLGNEDCVEGAANLFQKWLQSDKENDIPKHIREIVFCHGLKNGDEVSWHFMWVKYLKSKVATEKNMILDALGCTQQLSLLSSYLNKIIKTDSGLRQQDALRVFKSVVKHETGFETARKFFYDNIQIIHDNMSPPGNQMIYFLPLVGRTIRTQTEKLEFREFVASFSKHLHLEVLPFYQTLERLTVWQEWYEVVYLKLVNVLKYPKTIVTMVFKGS